jgi:predicted ArsR family transcriptional regulator
MPGFELPRYAKLIEPTKPKRTTWTKARLKPAAEPLSDADTVLDVLEKRGDLTASEIASLCPLTTVEVSRRTGELVLRKLIHDSGLRRKSPLGRPSIVWSAN